jgi:NitT/TauT family transport system permease protein
LNYGRIDKYEKITFCDHSKAEHSATTICRVGKGTRVTQIASGTHGTGLPPARLRSLTSFRTGLRGSFIGTLSAVALIALWWAAAIALPSSILPSPWRVFSALFIDLESREIWADIGITCLRIAAAFAIAVAIALSIGFAMALSSFANSFFQVWIIVGLTVPALVAMLTTYMVIGLNNTAAVIGAALPVIPILTINVREGVKGIDPKLMEMARAFRAGARQRLLSVIAPQVAPMLLASTRFGIGLTWKMVLFVELIGRSDGIGYKIEFYYQLFNMTEVLAHALSFLLVMLVVELAVLGTIERRVFGWRHLRS